MAESEATMSLGEELYKRIMDGDLDAPNIFSQENIDQPLQGETLASDMPRPTRTPAYQKVKNSFQQDRQTPLPQPKKMPAGFGRMTKNVLMNHMQRMQQAPQQKPNIYNNLGPGNQQTQQRPLMAINPNAMFMRG